MSSNEAEKQKIIYQKHLNQLHGELAKRARLLQETRKKLRKEQLRIAEMTRNMKTFDFKSLKTDLDYLQKMHTTSKSNILDEKLALSTLVNKLQKYVFDVESAVHQAPEELATHETNEVEYIENIDIYSPSTSSLNLGNSRELEERLKQYCKLQDSPSALEYREESYSEESASEPLSEKQSNSKESYANIYRQVKRRDK
jgi:hypothetical protein